MFTQVYRLENVVDKFNRVYEGPFRGDGITVEQISSTHHTAKRGFPALTEDRKLRAWLLNCTDTENFVFGTETLEELNRWFDMRHKAKGKYRLVKYAVPDAMVIRGTNQVVFDSRKARQIHVLE